MVEMTFGSGSPMWTTMPSVGLPYQSMGLGGFPISTPAFGSPFLQSGGGAISAQGASAPGGPPNLTGTGFAAPHPFASNPWASQFAGEAGVVTASSLLALVALRRGQPHGPASDAEVEDFIYDALDLLPGAADVE